MPEPAKKNYKNLYKKGQDGKYTAIVTELPGCISISDTKSAALKSIEKAIIAYEQSRAKHKEPAPL